MAIPMPKQQDIRRLDRQGVSRSEIARRLNVDRATVAKYADMDDMTPKPPMDRRRGSKIDPSCLCSMVLRPVERLVFSPKER